MLTVLHSQTSMMNFLCRVIKVHIQTIPEQHRKMESICTLKHDFEADAQFCQDHIYKILILKGALVFNIRSSVWQAAMLRMCGGLSQLQTPSPATWFWGIRCKIEMRATEPHGCLEHRGGLFNRNQVIIIRNIPFYIKPSQSFPWITLTSTWSMLTVA